LGCIFLQRAAPLQLRAEFGHLFAQLGQQAVACRELRLEGGFCGVGFARQRRKYIRRIEAGADEARGVVADPQMHVVAQPDARTAPPGGIRWALGPRSPDAVQRAASWRRGALQSRGRNER
jgi:hypothetical protein